MIIGGKSLVDKLGSVFGLNDDSNSAAEVGTSTSGYGWQDVFSGAASTYATQNAFSALEAQKERDWITEMSNTAYQRSMADLEAAGINPAAAYMSNGVSSAASVSSGASASSVSGTSSKNLTDILGSLAGTALVVAKLAALAG